MLSLCHLFGTQSAISFGKINIIRHRVAQPAKSFQCECCLSFCPTATVDSVALPDKGATAGEVTSPKYLAYLLCIAVLDDLVCAKKPWYQCIAVLDDLVCATKPWYQCIAVLDDLVCAKKPWYQCIAVLDDLVCAKKPWYQCIAVLDDLPWYQCIAVLDDLVCATKPWYQCIAVLDDLVCATKPWYQCIAVLDDLVCAKKPWYQCITDVICGVRGSGRRLQTADISSVSARVRKGEVVRECRCFCTIVV
ncbi:hypothetical protein J6590_069426 [Homalodisca vitripennis]|nr:hypothetical protein J6590_069426 [Homalodisca vitripennis]